MELCALKYIQSHRGKILSRGERTVTTGRSLIRLRDRQLIAVASSVGAVRKASTGLQPTPLLSIRAILELWKQN